MDNLEDDQHLDYMLALLIHHYNKYISTIIYLSPPAKCGYNVDVYIINMIVKKERIINFSKFV